MRSRSALHPSLALAAVSRAAGAGRLAAAALVLAEGAARGDDNDDDEGDDQDDIPKIHIVTPFRRGCRRRAR